MGDRALVILTDKNKTDISPTIYFHWAGDDVIGLIEKLKNLMGQRSDDVEYSCARLIGIAHVEYPGNSSLGVWCTPQEVINAIKANDFDALRDYSPGDAGIVIVNIDDFTWQTYHGYLAKRAQETDYI